MRTQAIPDCRYCPDPNRVAATSGALTINALALLALMIPISAIEIPKLVTVKPNPKIEATLYPPQPVKTTPLPSPVPPRPVPRAQPTPVPVSVPVPMPVPVETVAVAPPTTPVAPPGPVDLSPTPPGADVQLVPRSMPKPVYPRAELARGVEGVVLVRVRVGREGVPMQIRLERSSGNANLDRAALDGAKKWRFEPALQAGEAVEVEATVPVRFSILSG
jgi:protein TonB